MADRIPVVQGENVWRLLRTDRDSATRDEVLSMVGPAMHHMLHEAGDQFADIDPWQIVVRTAPNGDPIPNQWRIGAARPIVAVAAEQGFPPGPSVMLPAGRVLGSRTTTTTPGIPTVSGTTPWYILVRFWWRQADTSIDYPGYRVDRMGFHHQTLDAADWLLDRAIVPDAPDPDPGSETWGVVIGPAVVETIKQGAASIAKIGVPIVLGLIALGVVVYAAGLAQRTPVPGAPRRFRGARKVPGKR